MRRFLFFLLILGTCLAAAAHPGPSRQSKTEEGPGSDPRSFPASSMAASPSPETREDDDDEEEEQLDRLRHLPKTETDRESRPDAPDPPSAARRSLGSASASGEENDELPKEETRESKPESYRKYAGVKFSPADLADYIARTGDEESVALAVEELLREGIFTRAQAISYLQEVKNARDRFRRERKAHVAGSRQETGKNTEESPNPPPVRRPAPSERSGTEYRVDPGREREEEEAELERILDKMRAAASAEEYASEELIFRLFKEALVRSLQRDPTIEVSPDKIAAILESRASDVRISADARRKILGAASAALVDTLKELSEVPPSVYDRVPSGVERQIPTDGGKGRDSLERKSLTGGGGPTVSSSQE
ncbi:secretogranin-3-like [Centruroides sculpturatus]|uniref:secretogranin-3-like n=1 Tax=Centruroides sculpturatus TaxID=218467 RepID=UPI000C6CEC0B|nr:secretogranin-3-like [Centruroides sculpturatus]